jgi:hypothetical protein
MNGAEDSIEMQERRAVLKRVAWMLGGAVSAPAAFAILSGCSGKKAPSGEAGKAWAPKLLTGSEALLVSAIADTLIPRTDTGGASEADVPAFIDGVLEAVYPQDAQQKFKAGLAEFAAAATAAKGKSFLEQVPREREEYLRESITTALAGEHAEKPFVLFARELTLLGYYSSKVGITENMDYVAVPTEYHGCVPLSQMKRHVYWE